MQQVMNLHLRCYTVPSCYQVLNIASLYIQFLPARLKKKVFLKRQVYISLYCAYKGRGPSFFFSLTLSSWVIATTQIYQLQIKGAFATGIRNRWEDQGAVLGWKVQLFLWLVSGNVSQWHSFSSSSALWRITYCNLKSCSSSQHSICVINTPKLAHMMKIVGFHLFVKIWFAYLLTCYPSADDPC